MTYITTHTSSHRRLAIALVLGLLYLITLIVASLSSNSLTIAANAGHMLIHNGMLIIAFIAATIAKKEPTNKFTAGYYKADLIGSYTNGILLLFVGILLGYEAFEVEPMHAHGNAPKTMGTVAIIGLILHSISAWILHKGKDESLNVYAAFLHIGFDVLATLLMLATAVIIHFTAWHELDTFVGVFITIFILISAVRLLAKATKGLVDVTPTHLDTAEINTALKSIPHVIDVHNTIIRNRGHKTIELSSHLVLESGCIHSGHWLDCRKEAETMLKEKFGVQYIVLQMEVAEDHSAHCDHPSHTGA